MSKFLIKKENLISSLLFLFLIGIFFFSSYFKYETDFFWIIKGGEWIVKNHQIPHQDIWSYSMSNYPWIFHEWASGIIMYLVYSKIGSWALALFTSLITTIALILNCNKKLLSKYYPIVILYGVLLNSFVWMFRPQVFTFLGVSLIFYLVINYFKSQKFTFLLPIPFIFLIWVNLHGGFFVGLSLLFYFLILKILHYKGFFRKFLFYNRLKSKQLAGFAIIFIFSFLATLANPYSTHIYREVFYTLYAPAAYIGEWLPNDNFMMAIPVVLFMPVSIFVARKIPFEILSVAYIALISFFLQKFLPLFFILSLLPLCLSLEEFSKLQGIEILVNIYKRLKFFLFFIFIVLTLTLVEMSLASAIVLPVKAVDFLKKNGPPGQHMYNDYGWGGYLIYNFPEQKVFADGRMSSWVEAGHYFAKDDLRAIINVNSNFNKVIDKYKIDWMIFNVNKNDSLIKFLSSNSHWEEIYKDEIAIIYKRK